MSPGGPVVVGRLPKVRGQYTPGAALKDLTWFRVGGPAEVLFRPADVQDLVHFMNERPADVPVTVVGVGSNLLVREGGVKGVVIRLGSGFNAVKVESPHRVRAGAAALDVAVARGAAEAEIAGLEFLRGIPGTVGGGLRMNAGAYGREFKDILVEARAVTFSGQLVSLSVEQMSFAYRRSSASEDLVFIDALFEGRPGKRAEIDARMAEITGSREATQPVKTRTGGSTFKNPDPAQSNGRKAWQLIDAAGCRGLARGDAQVSEMHCNFLINRGNATADDIELLGEEVRARVKEATGVVLEWEIKRIGESKGGRV